MEEDVERFNLTGTLVLEDIQGYVGQGTLALLHCKFVLVLEFD